MKRAIIAGIVAGFISSIVMNIINLSGLWESQSVLRHFIPASTQNIILIDTTWCIVWGIIGAAFYAFFYDYIPSKGVKKGLVYSLIIWTIIFLRNSFVMTGYVPAIWAILWGFTGFFSMGITYGLVIGLLYRKPSD